MGTLFETHFYIAPYLSVFLRLDFSGIHCILSGTTLPVSSEMEDHHFTITILLFIVIYNQNLEATNLNLSLEQKIRFRSILAVEVKLFKTHNHKKFKKIIQNIS